MKSKTFGLFFVIFCIFFANTSFAKYSGGTGEPNNPYLIATPEDLNSIGLNSNDWDKNFKMIDDINLADYEYTASLIAPDINDTKLGFQGAPFTGTFDGQRHMITSLFINRPTTDGVGLFGYIGDGAVVCNVGLAEVDITARRNSGSLVGHSTGSTVCNSWSSGSVQGSHNYQMRLGGLIGLSSGADSYVYQCFSSVNVTATGGAHQVGGLAGYNGHGSMMSD